MEQFLGIVAYDPSEFLITALAGTPICQIQQVLAEKKQYLPFDPLFSEAGATLGGTLASGVSGPDRLLYGGIRDFIMEVAMLDGLGKLVRGGGKVVKNAAGFDTPKMMVGSYGRMGILLEATLKVFPKPEAFATLIFQAESLPDAVQLSQRILSNPFPIAGLDITADHRLAVRLAAPARSLSSAASRLRDILGPQTEILMGDVHRDLQKTEKSWLEGPLESNQFLAKIAVSPKELQGIHDAFTAVGITDYRHCCAGTVTWVKFHSDQANLLSQALMERGLSGVILRGKAKNAFLGQVQWMEMASRIQRAIDPGGRFLPWLNPGE